MKNTESKSTGLYILLALLFFQGVSGLYGGGMLVVDPTGVGLEMPPGLLDGSPFADYLIPGLILLAILGFFPLVVFYGLLRRKAWSWLGAVMVSLALIIWITAQIAIVGYQSDPPLQLIYGLVGVALLILSQLPSVRNVLNVEC